MQQDQFPYLASGQHNGGDVIAKKSSKYHAKRVRSNRNERQRNLDLNRAFKNLQKSIPYVPGDKQIPKIKTLRLAVNYIKHLNGMLDHGMSSTNVVTTNVNNVVNGRDCRCRYQTNQQYFPIDNRMSGDGGYFTDFSHTVFTEMLAKNSYTERAEADRMMTNSVSYGNWGTQQYVVQGGMPANPNCQMSHVMSSKATIDYSNPYGGISTGFFDQGQSSSSGMFI